jgi:hypothetical protein
MKFEDDNAMKLFGGQKRVDLQNLAPGAEREFKWVVISPPGKTIDVSLWARKGGGRSETQIALR